MTTTAATFTVVKAYGVSTTRKGWMILDPDGYQALDGLVLDTQAEAQEWADGMTRTRALYAQAWAAPLGTTMETVDGPLVVHSRLGLGETIGQVTLTSDGHAVYTTAWCGCKPEPDAGTWVRYERYSPRGREAHGYACPTCRGLTQTG